MTRAALAILASLLIGFGGLPQAPTGQQTWRFGVGDRMAGLAAPAKAMPPDASVVALPHRVMAPNTPLWYWQTMPIPPQSALLVDADDGAQVFVDGVRADQYRRWFFVPEAAAATRQIAIRVMNNAMQGGLRSVQLVPAAAVTRDRLDVRATGIAPVESAAFQARLPAAGQPCRFTAWADSQGGWQTFNRLVERMAGRASDFSVGVGDLVNDGSDPRAWRGFVDAIAPLASRTPVVPVAGNHDYDGFYNTLRSQHYLDLFRPSGTSWFAWSCGGTRLVAIDMNTEFPIGVSRSSSQHRWLMDEVRSAAWTAASWRILLVHQPPWSRSWAGYDGDEAVRAIVEPLVGEHGLDLVIAGHSHAYERLTRMVRGRAVHVLITGGAGGGLEAPVDLPSTGTDTIVLQHHFAELTTTREALTVEAVNVDGQAFDRWRVVR